MYIDSNTVIFVAELIGALGIIGGLIWGVIKYYFKKKSENDKQNEDINSIKEEQTLIVYAVLSCLKGLKEQGCNGPVTEAINRLEKHLNKKAHK